MRQIKILINSLDLALSNKYLEVVIQCSEPKILNEKVMVVFYKKNKKIRIEPQLSH